MHFPFFVVADDNLYHPGQSNLWSRFNCEQLEQALHSSRGRGVEREIVKRRPFVKQFGSTRRAWPERVAQGALVHHGDHRSRSCDCTALAEGGQGLNDEKAAGTAKEKGQMRFARENVLKRKMLGFSAHSQL